MTLHPGGAHSSSEVFGDDAWLSFNLIQSGWRSQAVRLCRVLLQKNLSHQNL